MRTAIEIAMVAAGLAAGSMSGASAGHASSDAPWCAVINLGMGDARWDCRYRTVEECVPNVIGGDRGSCSPNPTDPFRRRRLQQNGISAILNRFAIPAA